MIHELRFLIEARPVLHAHLQQWGDLEWTVLLLEPLMVVQRYGCREILMRESFATRIKLLYLASLRELTPLNDDAEAERYLGSARIAVPVFDRWWTVRALNDCVGMDELIEDFKPLIEKVDRTGDRWVDDWLLTLRTEI